MFSRAWFSLGTASANSRNWVPFSHTSRFTLWPFVQVRRRAQCPSEFLLHVLTAVPVCSFNERTGPTQSKSAALAQEARPPSGPGVQTHQREGGLQAGLEIFHKIDFKRCLIIAFNTQGEGEGGSTGVRDVGLSVHRSGLNPAAQILDSAKSQTSHSQSGVERPTMCMLL